MAKPNSPETTSFNDLPDHLLLHIIGLLDTLDAVRTTSISRRWRDLWTSVPNLFFDFHSFPPFPFPSITRRRFADFVDRTLILRSHSPITEFFLQFDFSDTQYCYHVDSWVRYAINHEATVLDVNFFVDPNDPDIEYAPSYYDFQFHSLKGSHVNDLRLSRVNVDLPYNISSLKFLSITSMSLDGVFLPDELASNLFSACVNLESLTLEDCYGMNNFRICSSKLNNLVLERMYTEEHPNEGESFVINAPNLSSISICCFKNAKYVIEDSSCLEEAYVSLPQKLEYYKYWSELVRLFSGVRRLFVQNWWFKLLGQKDVSLEHYVLNNLNHLELYTGYGKYDLLGIAELLYIAPKVRTMVLHYLSEVDEDKSLSEELLNKPIHFNVPNLKQVTIMNSKMSFDELRCLKLLKDQGAVLEKIVIVPAQVDDVELPPIVLNLPF